MSGRHTNVALGKLDAAACQYLIMRWEVEFTQAQLIGILHRTQLSSSLLSGCFNGWCPSINPGSVNFWSYSGCRCWALTEAPTEMHPGGPKTCALGKCFAILASIEIAGQCKHCAVQRVPTSSLLGVFARTLLLRCLPSFKHGAVPSPQPKSRTFACAVSNCNDIDTSFGQQH